MLCIFYLVSLNCPFLIDSSIFSNVYFRTNGFLSHALYVILLCYNLLSLVSVMYVYGCVGLFRQPITPTAHYSDSPLLRRPIFPTMQNRTPQIHGLTRCIQQDVPSVRLFLTDHGLDRMFWKGKGAFILGCTSPFKAIMIDRPGMGKIRN